MTFSVLFNEKLQKTKQNTLICMRSFSLATSSGAASSLIKCEYMIYETQTT